MRGRALFRITSEQLKLEFMNTEFKIKDVVRLAGVRYCPNMVVSEIDLETQQAKCVWYDTKTKKFNIQELPLNVLDLSPERPPLEVEAIIKSAYRL